MTKETLVPGSIAPDFTLPATGEVEITLSDLRPARVVLYFYPKDNTPGCTNQALAFSHHLDAFAAANCRVIGISKDSMKKHENFIAKHDLAVTLASDAEAQVCEAYGVWTEKKNYGRTYMGIERGTFLIGPDGRIEHIWRKVRVTGHVAEVLNQVTEA